MKLIRKVLLWIGVLLVVLFVWDYCVYHNNMVTVTNLDTGEITIVSKDSIDRVIKSRK